MSATATSDRDARLLRSQLDDVTDLLDRRDVGADVRAELEAEQEALLHLLDRIEERDFAAHVASLRD